MEPRKPFYSENFSVSGIEPWLERHLFQRLVRRIPAWIHPNVLSITNHAVAWSVLWLAGLAPIFGPTGSLLARIGAALGTFACVCLDCLDGMHARRTGQTSRLGEVMDHWLDSINVPLMAAAITLTLRVDPLTGAAAIVLGTIPYNAQLVLYHHTGRFIHPHTSGIDGQVYLSLLYILVGVLFAFIPQTDPWAVRGATTFAWAGAAIAISADAFYLKRLGAKLVLPHLLFVAASAGYSALYVMGVIGPWVFAIGVALLSFRISGTYVLATVTGRPYGGMDWSIPVWLAAMAGGPFVPDAFALYGLTAVDVLPWAFCGYLMVANLRDFAAELGGLRAPRREVG